MSVVVTNDRIILSGTASVEEAEQLLAALTDHPAFRVDIGNLMKAHLAIIQLLHAAQRPLQGMPENAFLCRLALAGLIEIKAA